MAFTQGTVGIPIRGTVKDQDAGVVNLSSASEKLLFVYAPGSQRSIAASFTTDGTDGKLETPMLSGDSAYPGTISWMAKVTIGGIVYYSDILTDTIVQRLGGASIL